MSSFLDRAEEIKTRLEALDELCEVGVLVFRQKDIRSEFERAIATLKGGAVIIEFTGFTPFEEDVPGSQVVSDFKITLIAKPILHPSATHTTSQILEAIYLSLHGWAPTEYCRAKANVGTVRLIPDERFLIYDTPLKLRHQPTS